MTSSLVEINCRHDTVNNFLGPLLQALSIDSCSCPIQFYCYLWEKINVKSRNEKERGIGDSEWILEIKENFIPVKKRKIREETLHASNEINIEKNCCAIIKVKTRLEEGTEVEIEKTNLKNGLMIPSSLSKVKEKKIIINVLNISNSSQVIKLNSELTKYVWGTGRRYPAVCY